ncbi:MAG: hypothetical protein PF569_04060 [Candidatus Woesearchaeota archaeon]|jgi:sugar-specific transcriptional regulator TrmB|nr:hypothetical protein [Candidatus Woesearchaeota archaeon]
MDIEKTLIETSGMTNSQAKIYLAILKLGECKSGEIILKTGIQSSVIHNSILSLIEKGFVSFVLKNNVKHYFATGPENIEEYIEVKKEKFVKIIPELELLKSKIQISCPKVEVFIGKKGMMGASLKLFEDAESGELHKYFGVAHDVLNEDIITFFEILDTRRKAAELVVKGISKIENKKELEDYNSSELRFTSLEIPPAMSIFKNKVLLMTFAEEFSAILIESEELAGQYHKLWDTIWTNSN